MAYENDNGSASAALEDSGETENQDSQDQEQESSDNCFYLPADFPGSENLKAGDTLTLRVRGKDADGDIEVEHVGDESEGSNKKPIMQDFEESMK